MIRGVVLSFVLLILTGVGIGYAEKNTPIYSAIPQGRTPLQVSGENFPSLAFHKLLIDIKPGTKSSEALKAMSKVKLADIYADVSFTKTQEESQKDIFESILKNAGYNVVQRQDLFNQKRPEANFLLGGKVIGESYTRYVHGWGFMIEQSYTVEWQLFEVASKKVIFSQTSSGAMKYKLKNGDESVEVLGECLKNMLSGPAFSEVLKNVKK